MRYYLSRGGQAEGPFAVEEVAQRIAAGELGPSAWVCPEGAQSWQSLVTVPELSALLATQPTSPPTIAHPLPSQPGPLPTFSLGDALAIGWRVFAQRYGYMLLLTLITIAASMLASIPSTVDQLLHPVAPGTNPIDAMLAQYRRSGAWISLALNFLLPYPLMVGSIMMAAAMARGEPVQFGLLWAPYRRFVHLFLTYLVTVIFTIPTWVFPLAAWLVLRPILPGATAGAPSTVSMAPRIVSASALLIVGGLVATWIGVRIWPALAVVIDRRYASPGPLAATGISWRNTRGHGGGLFVASVLLTLIMIGSALACLVPMFFFGLPYFYATCGAAYAMLFRGERRGEDGSSVRRD